MIHAHGSQRLAGDVLPNGGRQEFGPIDNVSVRPGDLVKLTVEAHQHDHTCDTTQIALTISESREDGQAWDLASEIVDRLHDGNPLADRYGNPAVWHFCQSQGETPGHAIPERFGIGAMAGCRDRRQGSRCDRGSRSDPQPNFGRRSSHQHDLPWTPWTASLVRHVPSIE